MDSASLTTGLWPKLSGFSFSAFGLSAFPKSVSIRVIRGLTKGFQGLFRVFRGPILKTADYADNADMEDKAVQNTASEALALQRLRRIDRDHD